MPTPPRPRLTGPPLALPLAVDAAARWWAGLPSRTRGVLRVATSLVVLAALMVGAGRGAPAPQVEVLVLAAGADAGVAVATLELRLEERPRDVLPDDVVTADAPPVGEERLRLGLLPGDVLRAGHLGPGRPHADVEHGRAVVALALPPPRPQAGDVLDLVGGDGLGSGVVLSGDARVVAVDPDVVWLDVGRDEVAALASAMTRGDLEVAWLPPG